MFQTVKIPISRLWRIFAPHLACNAADIEYIQKQASLRQEELNTILDASPSQIFYKDRENKIIRVNALAAKSLERSVAEIEGHYAEEFYPGEAAKFLEDDLEVINSGVPKVNIIEPILKSSGETRWLQTDKIPYRDAQGKVIGVIVFALDITDLKHAQENLQMVATQEREARLEAERLSRVKDEFLSTLSHELRTPMASIIGWTDLLFKESLDKDSTMEALRVVARNAKAELQLIDELLDMSRIISGKLSLSMTPIHILTPIEGAMETMKLAADAKHVNLELNADPGLHLVNGDSGRLQQVFWNLISNAIKFNTSDGKVKVRVAQQESNVIVKISDNGIGIKPDFLPHLFERFRQEDSSNTRIHGGLGLGLSLVKYIVESHGGTIHAESPGPGLGATFTVVLPTSTTSIKNW